MKVNNQHQQVIYYLLKWKEFNLKRVINHSMFYKFQTRLGEIERKHGTITKKRKVQFINCFNRKRNYTVYSLNISELQAKELFNQL